MHTSSTSWSTALLVKEHVMRTIIDEWPDTGLLLKVPGISLPTAPTEEERAKLRKGGLAAGFDDGTGIYFPAGLLTTAGTSMRSTEIADDILNAATRFMKMAEDPRAAGGDPRRGWYHTALGRRAARRVLHRRHLRYPRGEIGHQLPRGIGRQIETMNPAEIVTIIGGALGWLGAAIGFTRNTLDTTKAATDVFETGKNLLHIGSGTDVAAKAEPVTDIAVQRARAAADLIRSYTVFGFLEYLLWATKLVVGVWALMRWCETAQRWFRPAKNDP